MQEEKQLIIRQLETECTICGVLTNLAIQAGKQTKDVEIPKEYQEFARLFNNKAADRFPPAREWDHAIDLKPGAPDALDCKVYPMTRDEDTALEKFLDEMVAKVLHFFITILCLLDGLSLGPSLLSLLRHHPYHTQTMTHC
jgi:hypothetical protein